MSLRTLVGCVKVKWVVPVLVSLQPFTTLHYSWLHVGSHGLSELFQGPQGKVWAPIGHPSSNYTSFGLLNVLYFTFKWL